MEITIVNTMNQILLEVVAGGTYQNDYQLPMIRFNKIPGLLKVEGHALNNNRCYQYEIGAMLSMKKIFSHSGMKRNEIETIITQLKTLSERLVLYMLEPGNLLLSPECIFKGDDGWYFCYLPDKEKEKAGSFQELTEFFIQALDYEDMEGVCLAYELHKAALEKTYDLGRIMEEYYAHEQERKDEFDKAFQRKKKMTEEYDNLFQLTEEDYPVAMDPVNEQEEGIYSRVPQKLEMVREKGGWWKSFRKATGSIRRNKWGEWGDLT